MEQKLTPEQLVEIKKLQTAMLEVKKAITNLSIGQIGSIFQEINREISSLNVNFNIPSEVDESIDKKEEVV